MRCDNCGWNNLFDASRCVKCDTLLENTKDETIHQPETKGPLFSGTIKDASQLPRNDELPDFAETLSISGDPVADLAKTEIEILIPCPNQDCGYLNSKNAKTCVMCKTSLQKSNNTHKETDQHANNKSISVTIDPYRRKPGKAIKCFFELVPKEDEKIEQISLLKEFQFEEDPIVLNRNNLDENNNSITSKIQADLVFVNDKWYLSDRSELKTTFIKVGEKIELKDGDIILMGDRKFIFTATAK